MRARRLGRLGPKLIAAAAMAWLLTADAGLTGLTGPWSALWAGPAGAVSSADNVQLPQAITFAGTGAVGALFNVDHGQLGSHFCTATVVPSQTGNVLITAAHCVSGLSLGRSGSVVFAPGYLNGRYPDGLWVVTNALFTRRWQAAHDPNDDVAFLIVRRTPTSPSGHSLEVSVGADSVAFGSTLPTRIEAIGYPDASDQPIRCESTAVGFSTASLSQLVFDCDGFTDGTSGGPLLARISGTSGASVIIGVIGGYQEGGDTPQVSYSSRFAANIRALYRRAMALASTQAQH